MLRRASIGCGVLLAAAALEAGAGDEVGVKTEVSKPIVYYATDTPLSQFGCELVDIENRYYLKWEPVFDTDLEHIRVIWNSWELEATGLNNIKKYKKVEETEFQTELEDTKYKITEYLIFSVSVLPKTKAFYEESAKEYWRFRLIGEDGDIEYVGVRDQADFTIWNWHMGSVFLYTNTYYVYFRNPFKQEPPRYLRLIVEGGKYRHGFEWRFKEK